MTFDNKLERLFLAGLSNLM